LAKSVLFCIRLGAISRALHTKGIVPVRITTSLCTLAVAGLLGLFSALSALAQEEQQPSPPGTAFGPRVKPGQTASPGKPAAAAPAAAQTVATHGAWQIQCSAAAASGAQAGKKACGMVQLAHSEKNAKIVLSLILQKTKQGEKDVTTMRMLVPIGVYLPTGVALEIDGAAVGRAPFVRCRPQICEAFAEISPESLGKMQKGTAANFIIYEAPGLGIPMKVSLEGFSAALENLNSL
jgi:invasion protein IalB